MQDPFRFFPLPNRLSIIWKFIFSKYLSSSLCASSGTTSYPYNCLKLDAEMKSNLTLLVGWLGGWVVGWVGGWMEILRLRLFSTHIVVGGKDGVFKGF